MNEEGIQRATQEFEQQLRAWNKAQAQARNGYEDEAGFDKFIPGFSQELFQSSMGKRGASRNSKKKS
jgi:hypothetical protein